MNRVVARPPDSVEELCLIRLGFEVKRWSAFAYARRLGRDIARASALAKAADAGLLHSETFAQGPWRFGVLQYWRSFEAMEAWTHRPPHSEWWREAAARLREKGDFGISHETYLVPRDRIESIAINIRPAGLFVFGVLGEAVGADTNARGRLKESDPRES